VLGRYESKGLNENGGKHIPSKPSRRVGGVFQEKFDLPRKGRGLTYGFLKEGQGLVQQKIRERDRLRLKKYPLGSQKGEKKYHFMTCQSARSGKGKR